MRTRFAMSVVCLAVACAHARPGAEEGAAPADPTGIAAFSRSSRFIDARISPGGSYLAAIRIDQGKRTLAFIDLRERKMASLFRPYPQSVGNFHWVSDDRVVVDLWDEYGSLATPVNYGQLFVVEARIGGVRQSLFKHSAILLGRVRQEPHPVLFEELGDDVSYLWKMDVRPHTSTSTQIAAIPHDKVGFITDDTGEPRISTTMDASFRPKYLYRDAGRDATWTELTELRGFKADSEPFSFIGDRVEMIEPLDKGFGLFSVDLGTGTRTLLSRNDIVPPDGVLRDAKTDQLVAVEYAPDVPTYDFLAPDHRLARVLKGLLAAYPDEHVRIVSQTDDQKTVIAFVYSDRDPGRFMLVDTAKMSAEEIVATRPWINPAAMAEMTAFHIRATDGVWIHGYVTLPRQLRAGEVPPLVVLPHGGPHGVRDTWRYNPEVQLLASEGFAVLQVNFRGSGGYGLRYEEAGYRRWGDRVVGDILDATRRAIRKGHGDPKRTCIYGASFGAYAALQSAVVAPELFRCVVGYAGVYDLPLFDSEANRSWSRANRALAHKFIQATVGSDEAELKRFSPVYSAAKVKAPVLLIHGRRDETAPIEHARRLRKALEEAGSPPEWIEEGDEAHGFYDEAARERMYTRLVAFLHEHMSRAN